MKKAVKKIINTERVLAERPLQNKHSQLKRLPPLTIEAFEEGLSPEAKQQLTEMTGVLSDVGASQIVRNLVKATDILRYKDEAERQVQCNSVMALLHELDPQDAIEGMLCANITMLFLLSGYGLYSNYCDGRYRTIETFTRSVEALSKYRNKGKQNITVQHVNINEGANAVIGDLSHLKQGG